MSDARTVTSPGDAAGPRARVRRLVVASAPATPARPIVVLGKAAVRLGRDVAGADALPLPDPEASRLHAVVEPYADGWRVVDQASRNGVFVDGARVAAAPLAPGAAIRIGASLLVYTDDEAGDDASATDEGSTLLGPSVALARVRGAIARVATRPLPVLLLGESGVGKERVAEEIHRRSGRAGPLRAVNCAAIATSVADSELFGHAAGAFTGASARQDGVIASAHGGTLFLDEVGELAADVQAKLLRVLATGEVRAVGVAEPRKVDVRVLAATLRDLEAGEAGFRGDLYARLAGWVIHVPPLRDRREDILPIAGAALARLDAPPLSVGAAEALLLHRWPYNVRELEHALAAAAVAAEGQAAIRVEHLPPSVRRPAAAPASEPAAAVTTGSHRELQAADERARIVDALARCHGNQTRAAELLGMPRRTLVKRLARYGIPRPRGD